MEGGFKSEVLGLRGGSFGYLKFDFLFEIPTDEGEAAEQMMTNILQMNKGSTLGFYAFRFPLPLFIPLFSKYERYDFDIFIVVIVWSKKFFSR